MSKFIDLQRNTILYGDIMLGEDAFYTTDPQEQKLVAKIFEVARSVAELKLTEVELALYSTVVLVNPGLYSLTNHYCLL